MKIIDIILRTILVFLAWLALSVKGILPEKIWNPLTNPFFDQVKSVEMQFMKFSDKELRSLVRRSGNLAIGGGGYAREEEFFVLYNNNITEFDTEDNWYFRDILDRNAEHGIFLHEKNYIEVQDEQIKAYSDKGNGAISYQWKKGYTKADGEADYEGLVNLIRNSRKLKIREISTLYGFARENIFLGYTEEFAVFANRNGNIVEIMSYELSSGKQMDTCIVDTNMPLIMLENQIFFVGKEEKSICCITMEKEFSNPKIIKKTKKKIKNYNVAL